MKTIAIGTMMLGATVAGATTAAFRPQRGGNHNGADAFRDVVVACLVAGMGDSADDPVPLASGCIEATHTIWAATYGQFHP